MYLAYVCDTNVVSSTVESIRMVKDFLDVFSKELSRLPPDRKVDLGLKSYRGQLRCLLLPTT